jgi:uncharacterized protein YbjT (DUF2867 family)
MILVTGATGTNGRELIRQLLGVGERVRALVRDVPKAAAVFGSGVQLVEGDLDVPATLPGALEGIDRVFLLAAVDPRMTEMCANLIVAAKDAGIRQVVRFSGMGADVNANSEILRMHANADNLLRDSGLNHTILQPNSFMQNLLWSARTIREQSAIFLPLRDARLSLVDVRDLASVAVRVLTEAGHEGKTYILTGPEALSVEEMAAAIGKVIGKPLQYVDVSPAVAEKSMLDGGLGPWRAAAVTEIYMEFSRGGYADVTDVVARVTGRAPRTFADFVQDHASSFR